MQNYSKTIAVTTNKYITLMYSIELNINLYQRIK